MITLFDSEQKKIIGVFESYALAGRYLFPLGKCCQRQGGTVLAAFMKKTGIKNSDVCKRIVVRTANDNHISLLNGKNYYISDGYRPFIGQSDKGMEYDKRQKAIDSIDKMKLMNKGGALRWPKK